MSIKTINIMVNNECNLKCPHCDLPSQYKNYGKDLSIKEWNYLLDKLLPIIKPRILAVASREPLLLNSQEKTASIMKTAERHQVPCKGFVTNGYFVKDFWQKNPDLKVSYMDISVDGPPEINQITRGPKHFSLVEDFLKTRSHKSNIEKVFISTALTKWTAPKEPLSRFLSWVKGTMKVPRLVLLVLYPNQNVDKTLHMEDDDLLKILDLLISESRNFEDLFLDMFPSSLPGLAMLMEQGIFPKGDEFIRDDSGMLYGHIAENLYIRIENLAELEKYHMRISPEGDIIPVSSIGRHDYLADSHGNLMKEDWKAIQDHTSFQFSTKLPARCVGRTCASVCGGENYRCPILA